MALDLGDNVTFDLGELITVALFEMTDDVDRLERGWLVGEADEGRGGVDEWLTDE